MKKRFKFFTEDIEKLLGFLDINDRNYYTSGISTNKCIYIQYYECNGRYRESFMFEYWVYDNIFKTEDFDLKKYCDLVNYVKVPNRKDSRRCVRSDKNLFEIFYNNILYKTGIWADIYHKVRFEHYEINDFFNSLFKDYPNYYIINLEDIMLRLIKDKNFIELKNINYK